MNLTNLGDHLVIEGALHKQLVSDIASVPIGVGRAAGGFFAETARSASAMSSYLSGGSDTLPKSNIASYSSRAGRMGARVGQGLGTGLASGGHIAGMGAGVLGKAASFIGKPGLRLGSAGALGATAYMAHDIYRSINGYSTQPENLSAQMRAIAEQATYERSNVGGMGSPMNFSADSMTSALPVGRSFQRARGWSPEALGATGDLVFALNQGRRI